MPRGHWCRLIVRPGETPHQFPDDHPDRSMVGVHHEMGHFTVERIAHPEQGREPRFGVRCLQQWAMTAVAGTLELLGHGTGEVGHLTACVQPGTVGRIEYGTAPGRKNDTVTRSQLLNHRAFTAAEPRLAFDIENQGDTGASLLLDRVVTVDKLEGQRPSGRSGRRCLGMAPRRVIPVVMKRAAAPAGTATLDWIRST